MGFTLGVLSHYFGVSDPVIGILGCCSQVAASSLVAFSFVLGEWSLYVGKDFTEVAFALLTRPTRVRFSAFPKLFWIS